MLGSTVTITPYTQTTVDGGYSGQVETDSTAVSETAVPYEEIKKLTKEKMGDIETGDIQLALKYSASIDISGSTKYKATWQSEVYDVADLRRYTVEDTLVAYIITLSKRID